MFAIAFIIAVVLFLLVFAAMYYFENITTAAICFAVAIFFGYVAIAAEVYFVFIIPAFCIVWAIIGLKDNPPKLKKRNKKDKEDKWNEP